jgi:hypothetical protein
MKIKLPFFYWLLHPSSIYSSFQTNGEYKENYADKSYTGNSSKINSKFLQHKVSNISNSFGFLRYLKLEWFYKDIPICYLAFCQPLKSSNLKSHIALHRFLNNDCPIGPEILKNIMSSKTFSPTFSKKNYHYYSWIINLSHGRNKEISNWQSTLENNSNFKNTIPTTVFQGHNPKILVDRVNRDLIDFYISRLPSDDICNLHYSNTEFDSNSFFELMLSTYNNNLIDTSSVYYNRRLNRDKKLSYKEKSILMYGSSFSLYHNNPKLSFTNLFDKLQFIYNPFATIAYLYTQINISIEEIRFFIKEKAKEKDTSEENILINFVNFFSKMSAEEPDLIKEILTSSSYSEVRTKFITDIVSPYTDYILNSYIDSNNFTIEQLESIPTFDLVAFLPDKNNE